MRDHITEFELEDIRLSYNSGSATRDDLLTKAAIWWNRLSREERIAHRVAQRESWLRAEAILSKVEKGQ